MVPSNPFKSEFDSKRLFRALLLADWALSLLALGISTFVDPQILPPGVLKRASAPDRTALVFTGMMVVLYSISIVGLWRFRPWARPMYTIFVFVPDIVYLLFGGYVLYSRLSFFLVTIASMTTGAVLVFTWLVFRNEFGKPASAIERKM